MKMFKHDDSMLKKYLEIGNACTGCMACLASCPFDAITQTERDGFYYPIIDYDKCRQCGKCEKACPVIARQNNDFGEWTPVQEAHCHIGWHTNAEVRRVSSSGGIFSACAEKVLDDGGVVCGAIYDENMVIRHVAIENRADLEALRRSKYAQSDTSKIFHDVEPYLKANRRILFCGTPCQVAAMRRVFPRDRFPNLILISLACMAVASPVVFRQYVAWVEQKYGDKMVELAFRTKKYGWTVGMKIATFKNKGERTLILEESFFMRGFLRDNFIRHSCEGCQFRKGSSGADLTLGDFWGCGRFYRGAVGNKHRLGFSGVVVYTPEGESLLTDNQHVYIEEVPLDELLNYNKGWLPEVKVKRTAQEFLEASRGDPSMSFVTKMVPIARKERVIVWERHLFHGYWFPVSTFISKCKKILAAGKRS